MTMSHPGLPIGWAAAVWVVMIAAYVWIALKPRQTVVASGYLSVARMPFVGTAARRLLRQPWYLFVLKLIFVFLFFVIIIAGLSGSPIPERNAATVLTWNLWWAGLVLAILFTGSAWCGVCPWNSMAQWLVKRRLWRRADPDASLSLPVPKTLRSVWPALILFVGLTWLELGVGVTVDPFATAVMGLAMLVFATTLLALFERNAFCNYICPVGRTVGLYAQLAPVALRPIDSSICASCTSLECYHGSEDVDPCPTRLVMGRLTQNTYCTSCGNCARACPADNIAWRVRSPAAEAIQDARPHWDEAWFMLVLLALTEFHGWTMLPIWQDMQVAAARAFGGAPVLLPMFTAALLLAVVVPVAIYAGFIWIARKCSGVTSRFRDVFCHFAFTALPLAFTYHLAHNLNHLFREGDGLSAVFLDPLGRNAVPLSMEEQHARMMGLWLDPSLWHACQALLLVAGLWIALRVVQRRTHDLAKVDEGQARLLALPIAVFAVTVTAFHLWLLMQPMTMRF